MASGTTPGSLANTSKNADGSTSDSRDTTTADGHGNGHNDQVIAGSASGKTGATGPGTGVVNGNDSRDSNTADGHGTGHNNAP